MPLFNKSAIETGFRRIEKQKHGQHTRIHTHTQTNDDTQNWKFISSEQRSMLILACTHICVRRITDGLTSVANANDNSSLPMIRQTTSTPSTKYKYLNSNLELCFHGKFSTRRKLCVVRAFSILFFLSFVLSGDSTTFSTRPKYYFTMSASVNRIETVPIIINTLMGRQTLAMCLLAMSRCLVWEKRGQARISNTVCGLENWILSKLKWQSVRSPSRHQ